MQTVIYDGSFAGWLTAIFDIYECKLKDVCILSQAKRQDNIFGESYIVITDENKATRVWMGLKGRVSVKAATHIYHTFLSELNGVESKMLSYVQYVFATPLAERNFSNPAVLFVEETERKVHREKHRMEAFIRFKQTKDNLYYAVVEPDFNVLPLISIHFEKRYADQQWLIYDAKRKYGLYYDLARTQLVEIDFAVSLSKENVPLILDDKEDLYQQLWQNYFKSVNIVARKNMKLHIKHMPKRYWKYLIEKS